MKEIISHLEEKLEFEKKLLSNFQDKINNTSNTVLLLESAIKEMFGMEKETTYLKRLLETNKNIMEYSKFQKEQCIENISILNDILKDLKERSVSNLHGLN